MESLDPKVYSDEACQDQDIVVNNEENDFLYALQLQLEIDEKHENKKEEKNNKVKRISPYKQGDKVFVNDEQLELVDPCPNVHQLFVEYDALFFYNKLSSVEVKWSKRMKLCAGTCQFHGKAGYCCITLSEPLLKFRSRKEVIETLLHEMIHAFLFVTKNNKDRTGHGPEFLKHMKRINEKTNLNITVYHNFTDEVELYRQHWWRCDGPCRNRAPYYGFVKRSSNRAPGPYDYWWDRHRSSCAGKFIKVREPEKQNKKNEKTTPSSLEKNVSMDKFLSKHVNRGDNSSNNTYRMTVVSNKIDEDKFLDHKEVLVSKKASLNKELSVNGPRSHQHDKTTFKDVTKPSHMENKLNLPGFEIKRISNNIFTFDHNYNPKRSRMEESLNGYRRPIKLVPCPSCLKQVDIDKVNEHLDQCLAS